MVFGTQKTKEKSLKEFYKEEFEEFISLDKSNIKLNISFKYYLLLSHTLCILFS